MAGDSREMDMAHVDKGEGAGEGSLKMFFEERAWGWKEGSRFP